MAKYINLKPEIRSHLITEVSKLMDCIKEQARCLGHYKFFTYPLDAEEFMWLMHNLDNNKIGVTSLQEDSTGKPTFGCVVIDSNRACYFEAEGFTLMDMVDHGVIKVIQPKDIVGEMMTKKMI